MIKTQEELFAGPVRVIDIPEWGVKVSKLITGQDKKVLFNGEVRREGKIVVVEGEIYAEMKNTCRRCIEEFTSTANAQILRKISPAEEEVEEGEIELHEEDLDTDFYVDGEIDMREYFLMLAEGLADAHPLCSPDCKGLCQVCGTNLNKSSCEHKKQVKISNPPPEYEAEGLKMDQMLSKIFEEARKR